jgi:hypothetical protein
LGASPARGPQVEAGHTNALRSARRRLKHREGCYRWFGDGRCVDCGRYTGIASPAVELMVGGVMHYYDPRAAAQLGVEAGAVSPKRSQAPPPPLPSIAAAVGTGTREPAAADIPGPRPVSAEPISQRDLVRRDAPVEVAQPAPDDADVVVAPIQQRQEAPFEPARAEPLNDVAQRSEVSDPDAPDEGSGPEAFRARVRRAREHLALAAQQPKRKR